MQFNLERNLISPAMTACCVASVILTGAIAVGQRQIEKANAAIAQQASERNTSDRARALTQIAKEYRIDNCWKHNGMFTVDRVVPPPKTGKIPSTCLTNVDGQFAYIAEYNDAMRMQFVFTQTELTKELTRNP